MPILPFENYTGGSSGGSKSALAKYGGGPKAGSVAKYTGKKTTPLQDPYKRRRSSRTRPRTRTGTTSGVPTSPLPEQVQSYMDQSKMAWQRLLGPAGAYLSQVGSPIANYINQYVPRWGEAIGGAAQQFIGQHQLPPPPGYPSYYGARTPTVPPGGFRAAGAPAPITYGYGRAPGYDPNDRSTWSTQDWLDYVEGVPPQDNTGAFFNKNMVRNDVFRRDEEGRIIFNPETGRPEYVSQDWTDYMMEEGVMPHFGPIGGYPTSGNWTDFLLGKMGYGYGDTGINPYAAPYRAPQPPPVPDYGGGGYRGGGGRGGGGGGGGGGGTAYQQPSGYMGMPVDRNPSQYIPEWMMAMAKWNM
jgi:hypothetical protein